MCVLLDCASRGHLCDGTASCFYLSTYIGVGYGALIAAAWLNVFYIVVLAWAIYYLVASMATELPWASCGHWWNTATCRRYHELCTDWNVTEDVDNATDACVERANFTSPVREFWE